MDEIGSIVAEAIARRAKAAIAAQQAKAKTSAPAPASKAQSFEAQALTALQRRAQYGDKQAQSVLAKIQGAGRALSAAAAPAPPPVVASTPAPVSVPVVTSPAAPQSGAASPADGFDLDALPGLPTTILDGMSVERPMLLTAFSSAGVLPAIVFAEALAKPMALREGGPGSSF